MRDIFLIFFIFSCGLVFASGSPSGSCEHTNTSFRCVKYLRNYDGDTITFKIPNVHPLLGENISVRIAGIDTAETRGKSPCEKDSARISKRLVESKLRQAKTIELKNIQRDKYFRILAEVYVDGLSLKETLIQNHLAVSYDGGRKNNVNWCELGRRVPAQIR